MSKSDAGCCSCPRKKFQAKHGATHCNTVQRSTGCRTAGCCRRQRRAPVLAITAPPWCRYQRD